MPRMRLPIHMVDDPGGAGGGRAVCAAVELPIRLHAVADDAAAAVLACRCHTVDRAFEGVEGVLHSGRDHVEGHVVVVTADLADGHGTVLLLSSGCPRRRPTRCDRRVVGCCAMWGAARPGPTAPAAVSPPPRSAESRSAPSAS